MSEVAVYSFEHWDAQQGATVICERLATADAIRKRKGMADLDSKRMVSSEDLNVDGFYVGAALDSEPAPSAPQISHS
jgi:hypothetical protein